MMFLCYLPCFELRQDFFPWSFFFRTSVHSRHLSSRTRWTVFDCVFLDSEFGDHHFSSEIMTTTTIFCALRHFQACGRSEVDSWHGWFLKKTPGGIMSVCPTESQTASIQGSQSPVAEVCERRLHQHASNAFCWSVQIMLGSKRRNIMTSLRHFDHQQRDKILFSRGVNEMMQAHSALFSSLCRNLDLSCSATPFQSEMPEWFWFFENLRKAKWYRNTWTLEQQMMASGHQPLISCKLMTVSKKMETGHR